MDSDELLIDPNEWADEWSEVTRSRPSCYHCGQPGLQWVSIAGNWRLSDGRSQHVCKIQRKETKVKIVEEKFEGFYVLWQPDSSLPPKVRFYTKDEAYRAAELMTRKHKVPFYVMKAEGLCQAANQPIYWQNAKAVSK